jgi:hypothetical protein
LQSKRASADKLSWRGCKPPPKTANFPSLTFNPLHQSRRFCLRSFFLSILTQRKLPLFRCIRGLPERITRRQTTSEPFDTPYQASTDQPRQNVWCSVSPIPHEYSLLQQSPSRWADMLLCVALTVRTSLLSHANLSARLAGINVGSAHVQPSGDFGLIGLAVMGQNLILNAADHGYTVVAFNRTVSKVDRFLENEAKGRRSPKP